MAMPMPPELELVLTRLCLFGLDYYVVFKSMRVGAAHSSLYFSLMSIAISPWTPYLGDFYVSRLSVHCPRRCSASTALRIVSPVR
jgi:hypothetical protein